MWLRQQKAVDLKYRRIFGAKRVGLAVVENSQRAERVAHSRICSYGCRGLALVASRQVAHGSRHVSRVRLAKDVRGPRLQICERQHVAHHSPAGVQLKEATARQGKVQVLLRAHAPPHVAPGAVVLLAY